VKINKAFEGKGYYEEAYLAVTEIQNRLTLIYNPPSTAAAGGGNTGRAAIPNAAIGGVVGAGGHS
jgi:hypothetical protein